MEHVYPAWGVFAAAIGAHMIYWKLVRGSLVMKRAGADDQFAANGFWFLAATQMSLFAWPFVAVAQLETYDGPTVLSLILRTLAAAGLGWLLATAALIIWSIHMQSTREPGLSLRRLSTGATIVAPLATFIAYWMAFSPH